jgi:hypothetical protein
MRKGVRLLEQRPDTQLSVCGRGLGEAMESLSGVSGGFGPARIVWSEHGDHLLGVLLGALRAPFFAKHEPQRRQAPPIGPLVAMARCSTPTSVHQQQGSGSSRRGRASYWCVQSRCAASCAGCRTCVMVARSEIGSNFAEPVNRLGHASGPVVCGHTVIGTRSAVPHRPRCVGRSLEHRYCVTSGPS